MESKLRLIGESPTIIIDDDVASPLYRYFSSEDAVSNAKKETWVPGVNRNRFFHEEPDPNEYHSSAQSMRNGISCHESSVIIGCEAISFTTCAPEKWKERYPNKVHYWIRIDNITDYVNTLLNDCLTNEHTISWLVKNELIERAEQSNNTLQIAVAYSIPTNGTHPAKLNRVLYRLHVRNPLYDGTAYGKDENFEDQCETRIEFSCSPSFTSDEDTPHPSLFHLVEYYKFKTPNVSEFISETGKI